MEGPSRRGQELFRVLACLLPSATAVLCIRLSSLGILRGNKPSLVLLGRKDSL